ncbi:MAG: hypothetical protein WCO19_02615, partial [Candidatus Saccharibacteria bacterium]
MLILVTAVLFGSIITVSLPPKKAQALSSSDFKPGRIIDDAVFYNSSSMYAQDIQNFLNSKLNTCDTNGQNPYSGNPSLTRAQWAAQNDKPAPPYTCLKDYSQNVPAMAPDAYCTGDVSGGIKSAATIIKDVSNACSVNPQVLLVLLQKEQSLVTDDWPWPVQYAAATGFSCPDTAPCDPSYAGFFYQVYYGARQLQRYAKQANSFNYRAGQTSYILYNPNPACGGTNVYIENQATAALYNYTPYQPNTSALSNLYGSGDACGAYGNRNFWRMFNDWFGTTLSDRPLANANWKFENLEGGSNSLKPTNNTVGITPKTISFGGNLYVFYYDSTLRALRMASTGSTGWMYETLDGVSTVDGRISGDVGKAATAVVFNNMLHVYYYDTTNGSMRHTWSINGSSWNFETLDGAPTAVSGAEGDVGMSNAAVEYGGEMHVFYYDATRGNMRQAYYSTNNGWRFQNLDGDYGSLAGINSVTGQNPDATTFGGSLQLFYYDYSSGNLRHAWLVTGQSWKFENLDGDYGSIGRYNSNVGQDPSVVTHSGSLQLFYYDVRDGNLRHAWVNPGQSWKFENLDGDYGSIGR